MQQNSHPPSPTYIHGTDPAEQERLESLNKLTNASFIQYLAVQPNESVADFGCGPGFLAAQIAQQFKDIHLTGIERSQQYHADASRRLSNFPNVKLIQADVTHNNLASDSFDLTYCRYLLEHVQNPAAVAREMVRVTKPGGRIIAQENDLYVNLLDPEIPGFAQLIEAFSNLQIQCGGDPYIGRKLFSLFDLEEVAEIKLDFAPEIYSARQPDHYRMWMENMLRILRPAAPEILSRKLISHDIANSVFSEMENRIRHPIGAAYFYWNRITARKKPA